jgi:hypothetical protein
MQKHSSGVNLPFGKPFAKIKVEALLCGPEDWESPMEWAGGILGGLAGGFSLGAIVFERPKAPSESPSNQPANATAGKTQNPIEAMEAVARVLFAIGENLRLLKEGVDVLLEEKETENSDVGESLRKLKERLERVREMTLNAANSVVSQVPSKRLAHDVLNVLNNLHLLVELTRRKGLLEERGGELLEEVAQQIRWITDHIDCLRRIESEEQPPAELNELIRQSIDRIAAQNRLDPSRVETELGPIQMPVKRRAVWVESVLTYLAPLLGTQLVPGALLRISSQSKTSWRSPKVQVILEAQAEESHPLQELVEELTRAPGWRISQSFLRQARGDLRMDSPSPGRLKATLELSAEEELTVG